MRRYESLIHLRGELDEAGARKELTGIEGVITSNGGTIEKSEFLGRREIPFKMAKSKYTNQVLITFTTESSVLVHELERILRISDQCIRFRTHALSDKRRKVKGIKRGTRGDELEFATGAF